MFCSRLALSLPQVVTFSNGSTITYFYAADGTKVRTVHVMNGTTTQTDYCGNVIYENGAQKLLQTEEGYYDFVNGGYCYYLKDHQGNNRVVIDGSGTVKETNHYYPFGGLFAGTSVQPFKYNGKEFDSKNGLNWYDYDARHYDATLGRWHVVDPAADKYYGFSPYTYCSNNPLLFVDPNGKWGESVWDFISLGTGVQSLKENVKTGNIAAAIVDGIGITFDFAAAILPGIPGGVGAGIKAVRAADKVVDAAKVTNQVDNATDAVKATIRGHLNEVKVLEDIGVTKNTKAKTSTIVETNETITTIPDGITDTHVIEIKDTKKVYNSKQIRGERQYARDTGKKFIIITGEKTHVSKNIPPEEIVRRKDLGPQ